MIKKILLIFLLVSLLYGCEDNIDTDETFSITWLDTNGEILGVTEVQYGENPKFDINEKSNDAWNYIGWTPRIKAANQNATYTAVRDLNESYFIGNVFQIIAYDLEMNAISTGTGFVFNSDGWFITNNHVMGDGYYFEAIFDIKDTRKNESYTKLSIELASYTDIDKDILIGKISGYDYVGDGHYKEFTFSTDYDIDDKTFSVGYPYSSVKLEINEGNIESDLSNIYDKVYGGISYIGSSSFIAPGSSGGILLNEKLEIIGMTTVGVNDSNGDFLLGGSIESFNYINFINNKEEIQLVNINRLLHPDNITSINLYKNAKESQEFNRELSDEGIKYVRYWNGEGINNNDLSYSYTISLIVSEDLFIEYHEVYFWSSGDSRKQILKGYYSESNGINNFEYYYFYNMPRDNQFLQIISDEINYSENIELTLINYIRKTKTTDPYLSERVEYAKSNFNNAYEYLDDYLSNYN